MDHVGITWKKVRSAEKEGEEHDKIVRNEKIIFECQPDRSGGPDVLAVYRLCAPGYKG